MYPCVDYIARIHNITWQALSDKKRIINNPHSIIYLLKTLHFSDGYSCITEYYVHIIPQLKKISLHHKVILV